MAALMTAPINGFDIGDVLRLDGISGDSAISNGSTLVVSKLGSQVASLTMYGSYAGKIFSAAGLKPELKPTNEREFPTAARRPKFSALSNAKMEALGIEPMPSLDQAIGLYMLARNRKPGA